MAITEGTKYNDLIAIRLVVNGSNNMRRKWSCLCICGNETITTENQLLYNKTKSCGCRRKRRTRESALHRLYRRFEKQAKDRNLFWDLTKSEVTKLVSQVCFYCGRPPQQISYAQTFYDHKKRKPGYQPRPEESIYYNGLDRKDNNLGYVLNNVVSCCKQCNRAKDVHSVDEFLNWIGRVGHYQNNSEGLTSYLSLM